MLPILLYNVKNPMNKSIYVGGPKTRQFISVQPKLLVTIHVLIIAAYAIAPVKKCIEAPFFNLLAIKIVSMTTAIEKIKETTAIQVPRVSSIYFPPLFLDEAFARLFFIVFIFDNVTGNIISDSSLDISIAKGKDLQTLYSSVNIVDKTTISS